MAVMMSLLGGMGTFFGPFVGAAIFLTLENLVSLWTVHWQLVVGAIFVDLCPVLPGGHLGNAILNADEAREPTALNPAQVILRTEERQQIVRRLCRIEEHLGGIQPRHITSIIGPNGAGKSTYFNLLSGAFKPSSGRIVFEGRDVTEFRSTNSPIWASRNRSRSPMFSRC